MILLTGGDTHNYAQKGWIIDVCRTCHREAKWPFCEHRETGWPTVAGQPWCIAIPVVPTQHAKTLLRRAA